MVVNDLKNPKTTPFTFTETVREQVITEVQSGAKSDQILVIQTSTAHDNIPQTFEPLLLENP